MNRVVIFAAFVLVVASSALASGSDDPTGVWLTQAGDAKVAVSRCGSALCGRVVWLKSPIDSATGKPQFDDKNPNPQLTKRPIVGLQLFIGMRSQGAEMVRTHLQCGRWQLLRQQCHACRPD